MKMLRNEWPWLVLFSLAIGVQVVGYDAFSARFGIGLATSMLPLLPGIALLWWLDRLPPLGGRVWTRSLGWGLLIVPLIASNTHLMVHVVIAGFLERNLPFSPGDSETFGGLAGSMLSAPVMEESLKAALPLWYLCRRHALSGPWPALLVGSLTALGFGCLENTTHFATESMFGPLFASKFLFPYMHVFYSLPLFLAIGYAVYLPTLSRRLALVAVGWFASLLLHGLWNWEVIFGGSDLSVVPWYPHLAVVAPFLFIATILFVFLSETRALARSDIKVPGPLNRFRGCDVNVVLENRRERFEKVFAVSPVTDEGRLGPEVHAAPSLS